VNQGYPNLLFFSQQPIHRAARLPARGRKEVLLFFLAEASFELNLRVFSA
jgi:hypothetical protein